MKVFITGGSGFIGRKVVQRLAEAGHEVTILSRSERAVPPELREKISLCQGDPTRKGPWQEVAADHEGIINLAGASIFKRWSPAYKETILSSRVLTARNLVQALAQRSAGQTTVLVSASAVGYYGFRGDEELTETDPPGDDFLARVCQAWEAEADKAHESGVRVVRTRFGIVLGQGGGSLAQMAPLFKKGLGGKLGTGRQWFSWIHIEDLARALLRCLEEGSLSGPVNLTAPHPVTNQELTQALGQALHRPAFLTVPEFAIKLKMGEFGSVVLKGQRVMPGVLTQAGFEFRFPRLEEALADLVR